MPQQIIDEFFGKYLQDICPLLNPLIDHSDAFIKFRSDVVIKNLASIYENKSETFTELFFHIIPDSPMFFSFENIEKVVSHLLLTHRYIKYDIHKMDIILDLYYKTLPEFIFPVIVVKLYFLGEVDLNFISSINQKLGEVNKFSATDTGWWRSRKTIELHQLLSERNVVPFDFFEMKSYFFKKDLTYSDMFDMTLLNYYVPHIISISKLDDEGKLSLFKDIRFVEWHSKATIEDIENLGSMDQEYDDPPF